MSDQSQETNEQKTERNEQKTETDAQKKEKPLINTPEEPPREE